MPQAIRSKINPHYPHIKSQYYVDARKKYTYLRRAVFCFMTSRALLPCDYGKVWQTSLCQGTAMMHICGTILHLKVILQCTELFNQQSQYVTTI